MGIAANDILRDIKQALTLKEQGKTVTFLPPGASINWSKEDLCFDIKYPMYSNEIRVSIFLSEKLFFYVGEIYESGIYAKISQAEESSLEEVYKSLLAEGVITL